MEIFLEEIKLEKYINTFYENGIEDLESIMGKLHIFLYFIIRIKY